MRIELTIEVQFCYYIKSEAHLLEDSKSVGKNDDVIYGRPHRRQQPSGTRGTILYSLATLW